MLRFQPQGVSVKAVEFQHAGGGPAFSRDVPEAGRVMAYE